MMILKNVQNLFYFLPLVYHGELFEFFSYSFLLAFFLQEWFLFFCQPFFIWYCQLIYFLMDELLTQLCWLEMFRNFEIFYRYDFKLPIFFLYYLKIALLIALLQKVIDLISFCDYFFAFLHSKDKVFISKFSVKLYTNFQYFSLSLKELMEYIFHKVL